MSLQKDSLTLVIADLEQQVENVRAAIKPLKSKLGRLNKKLEKVYLERASLNADNFPAMLKDHHAAKPLGAYLLKFQGAKSPYEGVRREAYFHDKDYTFIQHAFSLFLSSDADVEKAEKFLAAHIQYMSLNDIWGCWDRPYVHFSVTSDEGGLDQLAWDGSDWYILRFEHGRVRRSHKMDSLNAALKLALAMSRTTREED